MTYPPRGNRPRRSPRSWSRRPTPRRPRTGQVPGPARGEERHAEQDARPQRPRDEVEPVDPIGLAQQRDHRERQAEADRHDAQDGRDDPERSPHVPTSIRPRTRVPAPGSERIVTSPWSAPSRSAIPCRPVPVRSAAGSNPAVVHDLERQVPVRLREDHRGRARLRVLDHVLQGLEARSRRPPPPRARSAPGRRLGPWSARAIAAPGRPVPRPVPRRSGAAGRCRAPGRGGRPGPSGSRRRSA